jgi:hypothetical protein
MQFLNQLLWSILEYVLAASQDVTQKRRKAILVPFSCKPIDQSPLHGHIYVRVMRIAGYHGLSAPEAADDFPEARSFPIHQQVSP